MKENFTYGSQVPRQAIPEAYTWQITDIFADEQAWETACAALKKELALLQSQPHHLEETTTLLALLQKQDQLAQQVEKNLRLRPAAARCR